MASDKITITELAITENKNYIILLLCDQNKIEHDISTMHWCLMSQHGTTAVSISHTHDRCYGSSNNYDDERLVLLLVRVSGVSFTGEVKVERYTCRGNSCKAKEVFGRTKSISGSTQGLGEGKAAG